jgi:hypothetical protein
MVVRLQQGIDSLHDGKHMSQKRKRRGQKIAGLTCGQMLLLFFLVVVVATGAALAFGYSLGIFDRFFAQQSAIDQLTSPPEVHDATPEPETIEPSSQPDMASGTVSPTEIGTITPVATETGSAITTATWTPTTPPTAPADVCAQLNLSYLNATSNIVAWRVSNTSGQPFTLDRIETTWPGSNDAIFNAFLDGDVIWSGQDLVSPTIITSWFGERDDRTIVSLSRLEFFFGTAAAESGYDLILRFENGCEVSNSK